MFSPMSFQKLLKVPVLPVKWIPARCGDLKATLLMTEPLPGKKLMTPSGRPASWRSFIR